MNKLKVIIILLLVVFMISSCENNKVSSSPSPTASEYPVVVTTDVKILKQRFKDIGNVEKCHYQIQVLEGDRFLPITAPYSLEGLIVFSLDEIEYMKRAFEWEESEIKEEVKIDIEMFGKLSTTLYTSGQYFKQVLKAIDEPPYEGSIYVDFENNIMYMNILGKSGFY